MKTAAAQTAEPLPDARGKRVVVVSARFYSDLADWLEDGAFRALAACGVNEADRRLIRVPGCFELPVAVRRAVDGGACDAVVALGVVVQGETPHFTFVAGECARGLMDVALESRIPVGFGVLTTDTMAQAEERADPERGDKGYGAAVAALSVAVLP